MRTLGNFGHFSPWGWSRREAFLLACQIVAAVMLTLLMARLANAQPSLQITTPQGPLVGVAFLVSNHGYWATSFTLLQNATAARLVFDNRQTLDVKGFVAASKAHDVVILATDEPPGFGLLQRLVARQHTPGDLLFPSVGPLSESLVAQLILPELIELAEAPADLSLRVYTPRLTRVASGADLMAGWQRPEPDMPGAGIDTEWLMMDVGLTPNCIGAPIYDTNQRVNVIGMLSSLVTPDRLARLVVDARQIDELVPRAPLPAQALSGLRKFEDGDATAPSPPEKSSLAQRGLHLAERFLLHCERLNLIEQSAAAAEKQLVDGRAQAIADLTALDALRNQLRFMQPEETYTETERYTVPGKFVNGRREESREETRRVTRRRFSQRQLNQLASMQRTRDEKGLALAGSRAVVQDGQFAAPWMARRAATTRRGLFYLADPLELRCEADHRQFEAKLNEIIAEGGAPGWVFLARGLCKLRLRKLDEAEADFRDAADVDNDLSNLAQMAEGRRQQLLGNASKGAALVSKAMRIGKDDATVMTLQARLEMDRKGYASAIRALNQALTTGGDAAELHLGLAWLYASTPGGSSNGRLAITHAQEACSLTGHKDWSSLAALAGAFARAGKHDEATATLKQAETLVPAFYVDQYRDWQAALAAQQTLERSW